MSKLQRHALYAFFCAKYDMEVPCTTTVRAVRSRKTASSITDTETLRRFHLDHDLEADNLAINLAQRKRLLLGAWLRRVCQLVHDVRLLQAFAHQCVRACKCTTHVTRVSALCTAKNNGR